MATPEKETKLQELWQKFLKQKPPIRTCSLLFITEIEPLRQKALEQLFRHGITKEEIVCIMVSVPNLREAAQKLLDWRNRNTPIIQKILGQMKAFAGKEGVKIKINALLIFYPNNLITTPIIAKTIPTIQKRIVTL